MDYVSLLGRQQTTSGQEASRPAGLLCETSDLLVAIVLSIGSNQSEARIVAAVAVFVYPKPGGESMNPTKVYLEAITVACVL